MFNKLNTVLLNVLYAGALKVQSEASEPLLIDSIRQNMRKYNPQLYQLVKPYFTDVWRRSLLW